MQIAHEAIQKIYSTSQSGKIGIMGRWLLFAEGGRSLKRQLCQRRYWRSHGWQNCVCSSCRLWCLTTLGHTTVSLTNEASLGESRTFREAMTGAMHVEMQEKNHALKKSIFPWLQAKLLRGYTFLEFSHPLQHFSPFRIKRRNLSKFLKIDL